MIRKPYNGRSSKETHCINCNDIITWRAIRCQSCESKRRVGKLNGNFGKKHPGVNKGKDNHFFGKPIPHGKWEIYKNIKMRSSYEVMYAKWLDDNGVEWLYENENFDLGNTTYTPDFYLPKYNKFVEVKGYWRDDAKEKYQLFRKQYPEIKIRVIDSKIINLIDEFI